MNHTLNPWPERPEPDKPKRPYRKGPRRTIFKKKLPDTRAERKAGNLEEKYDRD